MKLTPIPHHYESFNIVLIGVGGTGGNLAPMLARIISGNEKVTLTLVDGDEVETSNLERQPYLASDVGMNKAETLSTKLNMAFDLSTLFFTEYINAPSDLEKLFTCTRYDSKRLNILISCVDNHLARSVMERYFDSQETIVYIDSANEDYYGDVVLGLKSSNMTYLKTRGMYRPLEVFSGKKRVKNRSCEIKMNDNPQYLPANQMAATIILKMLSDIIIESSINTHFVNFDTHEYQMFTGVEGVEVDAEKDYLMAIDPSKVVLTEDQEVQEDVLLTS
jgi:hypothetical protein